MMTFLKMKGSNYAILQYVLWDSYLFIDPLNDDELTLVIS